MPPIFAFCFVVTVISLVPGLPVPSCRWSQFFPIMLGLNLTTFPRTLTFLPLSSFFLIYSSSTVYPPFAFVIEGALPFSSAWEVLYNPPEIKIDKSITAITALNFMNILLGLISQLYHAFKNQAIYFYRQTAAMGFREVRPYKLFNMASSFLACSISSAASSVYIEIGR